MDPILDLNRSNMYKRPKPRRVDANKRFMVTKLPPVLCLHVKGLYFDPVTNKNTKCIQHIEFPEILDITLFCSHNITSRIDEKRQTKSVPLYRLMSVIEHRGNAFAGHYLTYQRVLDKPPTMENDHNSTCTNTTQGNSSSTDCTTGSWVVVSDEKVA